MMKKSLIIISALLVVFVAASIYNVVTKEAGFQITLKNNLTEDLNDIVIHYPGGSEYIALQGKSKTTIKIDPGNQFGEGEIIFKYVVSDQIGQSERIFGYIEPGYTGKAKIVIKSIQDNGKLELDIDAKVKFY